MTDRDSDKLQSLYDEEDPAVIEGMLSIIISAIRRGKEVGFCGMGVSNSPFIAAMCATVGITSASVTPDVYVKTKELVYKLENSGLGVAALGDWMNKDKAARLRKGLESLHSTGMFTVTGLVVDFTPTEAVRWIDRMMTSNAIDAKNPEQSVQDNAAKRAALLETVGKMAIQATTDYGAVLLQALNRNGFKTTEEYDRFLNRSREFNDKLEELIPVIADEDNFNHSTTFRRRVNHADNLLTRLPEQIQETEQQVVSARSDDSRANEIENLEAQLKLLKDQQTALSTIAKDITTWKKRLGLGIYKESNKANKVGGNVASGKTSRRN